MFYFKLLVLIIFGTIFLMPSFVFTRAWLKFNLSKRMIRERNTENGNRNETGFEELPTHIDYLTTDDDGPPELGCSNGLYLGDEDIYINCKSKCQHTDYSYKFIDPNGNENIIINNKKITGAYCLPNTIAKCNLNNSYALIGTHEYTCSSKYPMLFGGESGNEIIGCSSNSLKDNLLNRIYHNFIPGDLFIDDINEKTETGEYRFECVLNKEEIHLPKTIGSRFESEINICNKFDANGIMDFEKLQCKCDNYINNDTERGCTTCTSGWDVQTDQHGSRYGYTIARDCIDPLTVRPNDLFYIPCGKTTLSKNKRCEQAILLATNTYSPMALENMFT